MNAEKKQLKQLLATDLLGEDLHFGFGVFAEQDYKNSYMIDEFCLEPGQVCRIIGSGFSGKTNAMLDLVLAAATNGKWLGKFQVKMDTKKKAMFIALEGSKKRLMKRANRIGTARGIKYDEIFDRLVLKHKPNLRLEHVELYSEYVNTLSAAWKDFGLIVIDNQRTLAPSVKENESDGRWILDVLSDVSERIGAVIIVLHHTGKDESRERGSSGFWDATGCQWLLKGRGRAPKILEQVKSVEECYLDLIGITFDDVGNYNEILKKNEGLKITATDSHDTEEFESDQISKALEIFITKNPGKGKTDILKAVSSDVKKKIESVRNILDVDIISGKYNIVKVGRIETIELKPAKFGESDWAAQ